MGILRETGGRPPSVVTHDPGGGRCASGPNRDRADARGAGSCRRGRRRRSTGARRTCSAARVPSAISNEVGRGSRGGRVGDGRSGPSPPPGLPEGEPRMSACARRRSGCGRRASACPAASSGGASSARVDLVHVAVQGSTAPVQARTREGISSPNEGQDVGIDVEPAEVLVSPPAATRVDRRWKSVAAGQPGSGGHQGVALAFGNWIVVGPDRRADSRPRQEVSAMMGRRRPGQSRPSKKGMARGRDPGRRTARPPATQPTPAPWSHPAPGQAGSWHAERETANKAGLRVSAFCGGVGSSGRCRAAARRSAT